MCVSIGWLALAGVVTRRDDTIRFTDIMSREELAAVKLEEQPMLLRAAGDNVVVIASKFAHRFL